MLVGQNGQPGENRQRRRIVLGAAIGNSKLAVASIVADDEFVIPTGGGFEHSELQLELRVCD